MLFYIKKYAAAGKGLSEPRARLVKSVSARGGFDRAERGGFDRAEHGGKYMMKMQSKRLRFEAK